MADDRHWRRTFDTVDRAVAARAEELTRTQEFAVLSAWTFRILSGLRDQVDGLSAGLWHLVNLPARTDLLRLNAQLGELDREVRRLALQLRDPEKTVEEVEDAATTDSPGAGASRGRAQRPARP